MSLEKLASLIHERNQVSNEIAKIIGRPALIGHIGEYVASKIFDIQLESSATATGIDGRFTSGPLKGRTSNIKLYGKKENFLDISLKNLADYYLVMTGPDGALESSKGKTRPLIISQVFLFNMNKLVSELKVRGVKIGIATSIRKLTWESAMIYPVQRNSELILIEKQMERLSLFNKPHARTRINSTERGVDGNIFTKVCEIRPILEKDGTIYIEKPYLRYRNTKNLELHKYGSGPFCSFSIPLAYNGMAGVYGLQVNGEWAYIGKTIDLGRRYNQEYGNISPRNCFVSGPETTCRINNQILLEAEKGSSIILFFHESDDSDRIETELIGNLNPPWNRTKKRSLGSRKNGYSGKYRKLYEYLSDQTGPEVTLSLDEIEEKIGFKLPNSAYRYRPWWANGGHSQCRAWMNAGWVVDKVSLGDYINFRKKT